jgi:mannose-6-phosphate isomerase-like protein (cupin superfamily)
VQHTAIEQATKGLASVRVLRSSGEITTAPTHHHGEFWFLFVLEGSTGFAVNGSTDAAPLAAGDSVAVPAGLAWGLRDTSPDLKLLEIVVP